MRDVNDKYTLDFIAWQVADGVPSEMEWVRYNLSYYDCLKILMMRRYDAYVQDRILQSRMKKNG